MQKVINFLDRFKGQQIIAAKKQNPQADTTNLEREIDQLVYRLYDLTEEEIKIIENQNEKV